MKKSKVDRDRRLDIVKEDEVELDHQQDINDATIDIMEKSIIVIDKTNFPLLMRDPLPVQNN